MPVVFSARSLQYTVKMIVCTCPSRSDNPIVMLSFSPDDLFLLTSAVDNEVRQYTALDGRLNLIYDIPKLNRTDNYTRSYFVNGGGFVVSIDLFEG
jgi:hypothetical protein